MSLSYKVTQEENLRGDDGGVGEGLYDTKAAAGQRRSAAVQNHTEQQIMKKQLHFDHLIKEAMEIKKMTISRFYLHSENDTSDSLFLSTPPPPPHVCLSSSSSILPLSFRGSKMVLLQRTGPPCGFHSPLIYACISIHVCVRCACVCVFLSVIILYGGPKGSMHCSLRKRM